MEIGIDVVVEGTGPLAEALRGARVTAECSTTVVVAEITVVPIAFADLTDDDFDRAWEQPMRNAIAAFQRAHHEGHQRLVAVVPTIGMSGAPRLGHAAATAEAIRVMVKSAARQWGAAGMTVNCIAVAPDLFGIAPNDVGAVSLAPAALGGTGSVIDDIVPLICLVASRDAHHITGSTLTADGGVWMTA